MDTTIEYYNKNAKEYAQTTRLVDMQEVYNHFEEYLLPHSHILDVGCGSGRDAKHFKEKEYLVTGIDASIELCKIASQYAGITVINSRIEDVEINEKYDAIWACASLLHVERKQIVSVFKRLYKLLKEDGIFYASWKYGTENREENGKYYCDFTIEMMTDLINKSDEFQVIEAWESIQKREGKEVEWINFIFRRK